MLDGAANEMPLLQIDTLDAIRCSASDVNDAKSGFKVTVNAPNTVCNAGMEMLVKTAHDVITKLPLMDASMGRVILARAEQLLTAKSPPILASCGKASCDSMELLLMLILLPMSTS